MMPPHERRPQDPVPFQQRTNTSCYLIEIPTHGFTVVLSVFRGTPPAKPLNCKSVSNRLGARIRSAWAYHTGGTQFVPALQFVWHYQTSPGRHFIVVHRHFTFRFGHPAFSGKQKTLLTLR
jgi:hypothetical protein